MLTDKVNRIFGKYLKIVIYTYLKPSDEKSRGFSSYKNIIYCTTLANPKPDA